jgi:hypothetical protein
MPRLLAPGALALALLATACTQDVPRSLGDTAAVTTPAAATSALYSLHGPATLADGRLTLTTDRVAWFTDRPLRRAGSIATTGLPAVWTSSGFDHDPPNGELVIGNASRTVELTDPRVSGTDVSFAVRGVGRRLPARSAGTGDLFIDGGALPSPTRSSNCFAAGAPSQVTVSPDLSDQCPDIVDLANSMLQQGLTEAGGSTWQAGSGVMGDATCTSPLAGTVTCSVVEQTIEDSGILAAQVTSWFVATGPPTISSDNRSGCVVLQTEPDASNQTLEVTLSSVGDDGLPPCAVTATLLAGLATILPAAPGFTGGDTPIEVLGTNLLCPALGTGGPTLSCTGTGTGPVPDPEMKPAFDQATVSIIP